MNRKFTAIHWGLSLVLSVGQYCSMKVNNQIYSRTNIVEIDGVKCLGGAEGPTINNNKTQYVIKEEAL